MTRIRRVRARLVAVALAVVLGVPAAGASAADGQRDAAEGGVLCRVLDLVLDLDCGSHAPPPATATAGAAAKPPAAAKPDGVRRTGTSVEYDPQRLTVTFRRGTPRVRVNAAFARAGVTLERAIPQIDAYMAAVAPARHEAALASLRSEEDVTSAGREVISRALDSSPNDAAWPDQWGLRVTGIPRAWTLTVPTRRVVVAVLDTGVDAGHPDLQQALVPGYDFVAQTTTPTDREGHGTAVAGVIAARTNNHIGIAGVCGACVVMPVKVLGDDGVGDDSVIAAGIVWAADHGAGVINMSLGGPGTTPALNDALAYAAAKGTVILAAAGNSAASVEFYPAADPHVISVGGTTEADRPYEWSNFGDWVKLAAPGCNVAPTLGDGYVTFCGTSSATPVVAGVAALALSANGELTPEDLMQAFERPAVPISGFVRYGRIDARATLSLVSPVQTVAIKGTLTRTKPNRSYTRSTTGGALTATVAFTGARTATLTLIDAARKSVQVSGSSPLRLSRVLSAGPVRIVVGARRARVAFRLTITEAAARP